MARSASLGRTRVGKLKFGKKELWPGKSLHATVSSETGNDRKEEGFGYAKVFAAQRGSARRLDKEKETANRRWDYRLAIFWAMYRISLRSSSSTLLKRRRSLLRKRASFPTLPQAISSDDFRLGRLGS